MTGGRFPPLNKSLLTGSSLLQLHLELLVERWGRKDDNQKMLTQRGTCKCVLTLCERGGGVDESSQRVGG